MVYESLIAIVESHLSDLTKTWADEVRKTTYLDTYKKLSDAELTRRGNTLFLNIQNWLLKGASIDDAETYFYKLGAERFNEGFSVTEVYYALHLEKKVLWSFVAWKDEVTGILEAHDAIEFMAIINNYFDLGDFNIIRGYMNELYSQLKDSNKFKDGELEKLIAGGALYQESIKEIGEKLFGEGLSIDLIK